MLKSWFFSHLPAELQSKLNQHLEGSTARQLAVRADKEVSTLATPMVSAVSATSGLLDEEDSTLFTAAQVNAVLRQQQKQPQRPEQRRQQRKPQQQQQQAKYGSATRCRMHDKFGNKAQFCNPSVTCDMSHVPLSPAGNGSARR